MPILGTTDSAAFTQTVAVENASATVTKNSADAIASAVFLVTVAEAFVTATVCVNAALSVVPRMGIVLLPN